MLGWVAAVMAFVAMGSSPKIRQGWDLPEQVGLEHLIIRLANPVRKASNWEHWEKITVT